MPQYSLTHLADHALLRDLASLVAHRSKSEIELLLARRFPRPDLETRLSPLSRNCQQNPLDPDPVDATCASSAGRQGPPPPAKLSPLSPQRFALQVTLGDETREKLRYAQGAPPRDPDGKRDARASDVKPWLRALGFRTEEAKRGASLCAGLADASLEERVRHALTQLAPASARRGLCSEDCR